MRKFYISFDYEGIAGVSHWNETSGNYRFDLLATEQLNKFCEGIFSVENCEIVVSDSHSLGTNLVWEKLHKDIKLIKGCPRNQYMLENLNDTFTDLVLFGYHTGIGQFGMMDHTYSASSIYKILINDEEMDETTINANFAAEQNVPLAAVFGDDQTCLNITKRFPNALTLTSKKAISRFSGEMIDRETINELLFKLGENAIRKNFQTHQSNNSLEIKIEFINSLRAYLCSVIPTVKLIDARTIHFKTKSYKEFYRYLMNIVYICAGASNFEK